MGHVTVTCNACHDQFRQTRFYEPAHDAGARPCYRMGVVTGSPALSASATTARAMAAASGPVPAGKLTTQMISSAVCALTMLAPLSAAARLAVTAELGVLRGSLRVRDA